MVEKQTRSKSKPAAKSKTGSKSAAKSARDCNCYATGFHPLFGQRNPQKKLVRTSEQAAENAVEPVVADTKPTKKTKKTSK